MGGYESGGDGISPLSIGAILVLVVIGAAVLGLWGCPKYGVYSAEMDGKAQLAHAHYSRQVQVTDAEAKAQAMNFTANAQIKKAQYEAQAQVEKAKGVAEANRIIGQSLHQNEDYLTWLWIENLKDTNAQLIYIPSQGGLPVLEAGRFGKVK